VIAFLQDISWAVVVSLAVVLAVVCFLAILWSKREWNTRKIRVGMFLEREYHSGEEEPGTPAPPPADDAPTKEWPYRKE
jgi:cell division protein FtsW (lipid II flippase)